MRCAPLESRAALGFITASDLFKFSSPPLIETLCSRDRDADEMTVDRQMFEKYLVGPPGLLMRAYIKKECI